MRLPVRLLLVPCAACGLQAQSLSPSIRVVQHLDFGALVADERGGRVALTEQGALLSHGSGVGPARQSQGREARFLLSGPPKAAFTVTLLPQVPELPGPGPSLRVPTFVLGSGSFQGTFDAEGKAELRLGAQLDIPAASVPGVYQQTRVRLELVTSDNHGAQRTSELFTVRALLRPVLRVANQGPLDFGNLIPGSRPGAYRVAPVGPSGALDSLGPQQFRGTPRPAEFSASGTPGAAYSLVLPREVLLRGPGAPVVVRDFTASVPLRGFMPTEGFIFRVGGTLVVPAAQAPGRYTGVFAVSLDYQ